MTQRKKLNREINSDWYCLVFSPFKGSWYWGRFVSRRQDDPRHPHRWLASHGDKPHRATWFLKHNPWEKMSPVRCHNLQKQPYHRRKSYWAPPYKTRTLRPAGSAPCCRAGAWGWGWIWNIFTMTDIFLHVFSAYFAPHPPVADQSWKALLLSVGASLAWLADQNHPLMFLGKKSGLSQPSKSHRRPEVQKYGTFTENKTMMTANLFDKSLKSYHWWIPWPSRTPP